MLFCFSNLFHCYYYIHFIFFRRNDMVKFDMVMFFCMKNSIIKLRRTE